ncbi:hypothetical protein [Streptomyces sp. NPDC047043]|uniref:hypothetical protein n=1 Tax=Streptomyces sp. NPDC047043 TaxID=3154497 RepID=UPI0033EF7B77
MTGAPDRDNIAQSLNAAAQALDHLEHSLRAAGFPDGTGAYQRMADVLLAQRLYPASPDPELMNGFEHIGRTAGRIYGILHPYTAVMLRLAALGPPTEDATGAPAADTAVARTAVLAELRRRGRRGASLSVLIRATGLTADAVESVLDGLVTDGHARVRRTGEARSYTLALPEGDSPRSVSRRPTRPTRGGR